MVTLCIMYIVLISRLPAEMLKVMDKKGNGDWLNEVKDFFLTKKQIYSDLSKMSPEFYWYAMFYFQFF